MHKVRTSSIGPGEGDLVERFRPEPLRGASDHAAAKGAVKFGGGVVVRERPDHHATQAALAEVPLGGGEEAPAEAQTLKFRAQIELVDFTLDRKSTRLNSSHPSIS